MYPLEREIEKSVTSQATLNGRECLLLFSAESFVFQFPTQKVKDQDI